MEAILKYNIFEFDGDLFQQLIGTAMGCRPAPSYTDIYLANRIDKEIRRLSSTLDDETSTTLQLFKIFLDDLFQIFVGSSKKL